MSLKDIKAQDNAIAFLKNSIEGDKVSHAYMFVGPSGVGKKLAAVNFAKALNCLDLKDNDSCDKCAQCKKIDSGNHPDVLIFSPKKEDASLGIDKIRSVTKDIGLKPYEGRKKVYILESADSMTQEAQNALLKTLEEPVSDSVLILMAESVSSMFSTIQSRAKRIRFFPIPSVDVKNILKDTYKLDDGRAEILSRISSGELNRALKYNDEDFFEKRRRIIDAMKDGAVSDLDFDGFSKQDLRMALEVMLTWYRDVLVAKAGVDAAKALVNIDKMDLIYEQAKRSSYEALNSMINQVVLTGSFLDENANPKLAMGVLGINLMRQ